MTIQQADWIAAQIESGRYDSASEVMRELSHERQILEQEMPEKIERINEALIAAEDSVERSGYGRRSIDEIWEEAKTRYGARRG